MNLYDYFKLLEPLAKAQVAAMPDGEQKSVLTFILAANDAVAGVPATETTAQKLEAFATKAIPHLQAVLPLAGPVGSLVGVAVDLGGFLLEALVKTPTGTITAPCGDDGMPIEPAKTGEV